MNREDRLKTLGVAVLSLALVRAFAQGEHRYVPPEGYVPNAETALAVGKAVLYPVYGKAKIEREAPFRVRLAGDVWTVEGSLPRGWRGGVALVWISRRTGAILRMTHGK